MIKVVYDIFRIDMENKLGSKLYIYLLIVLIVLMIGYIGQSITIAYAQDPQYVEWDFDSWDTLKSRISQQYENDPGTQPLPTKIVITPAPSLSTDFQAYYNPELTDSTILYIMFNEDYDGICFEGSTYTSNLFYYRDSNSKYGDKDYISIFGYVTEIQGLEYIDFSSLPTAEGMFKEMRSLKSIDLSSANLQSCQKMSFMFYNCSSLESLSMPTNEYGGQASDKRGMFYGLDSLTRLDLSNLYPTFTNTNYNYNTQLSTNSEGLYTNFIKADNLQVISMPKVELVGNNTASDLPKSLASDSIGEFAIDSQNIKNTLGDMLLTSKTLYKVGYVKYVLYIEDVAYTIGTDIYLATMLYTSKAFAKDEIDTAMAQSNVTYPDAIPSWSAVISEATYSGDAGSQLSYISQKQGESGYQSPMAYSQNDPLILFYKYDADSEVIIAPINPENNPVIEELDETPIEDNELSPGAVAGIVGGLVAGAGILGTLIAGFATFRFTEIEGATKLVFMIKKSAEECTVINFKGKRFKIKRKNLRRRKKKKDDDDDDDDDRWFKKIPIFYIKWLK